MSKPSPSLKRLEEIIRKYEFEAFAAEDATSRQSVSQLLAAAKANDAFWDDLATWKKDFDMAVDLEQLRSTLPREASEDSAEVLLGSIGFRDTEIPPILDIILAQQERHKAVAEAFEASDPAAVADTLESVVSRDAEKKREFLSIAGSFSLSSVIVYLLVIVAFLTLVSSCTLYKGVTPQNR